MLKRISVKLTAALVWALFATMASAELVVIVHPDNPVTKITQAQLKQIFLGRMPLFPDSKIEIVALDLPGNDPEFSEFYQKVVNLEAAKLKRYRAYYLFSGRGKLPKEMDSANAVVEEVLANQKAIGYIDQSHLKDNVRVVLTIAD